MALFIVERVGTGFSVRSGENTLQAAASALTAEGWADAAALSAATAEAAAGPTYASTAAGLAATTSGEAFAVDAGGGLVSVYLNSSGTAVLQRTLATSAYSEATYTKKIELSATGGADLIGVSPSGTMQDVADKVLGQSDASVSDPTLDGGLIGIAPDGNNTKTARRFAVSLSGTRTKAKVAQTIEVTDGQTGPASAAGVPTPDSASYALSLVNVRPNWNTAGTTGEADGMNIFIRQASGDSAGILSNILVRSGFAATLESYTGSADAAGAVIKAVNIQAGVVNPRDGGEYGYIAQATNGTNLTAGFTSLETGSATWGNAFQHVNAAGQTIWYVRAADGAMIGGSVAPRIDAGADLGAPSLRFNSAYLRQAKFSTYTVAQLPAASGNAGLRAVVSDANATTFNSIVAGGGSNTVPVFSDGTDWRIG